MALAVFCSVCVSSGSATNLGPSAASTPEPAPTKPEVRSTPLTITLQKLNDEEAFEGAGTAFQLASEPLDSNQIIFGYGAEGETAKMRISNQLYELKQTSSRVLEEGQGDSSIGAPRVDVWSAPGDEVEFDYKITDAVQGGVGYKGQVTIKMNGQQASFQVRGGSGC